MHTTFAMISRWVFEGELVDPHGEFFVAVAEGVADEELWSRKYAPQGPLDAAPVHRSTRSQTKSS